MNASAATGSAVNVNRAHELMDMGLAYIRAAIRANLAEVDPEIATAGILHPAWSRSLPPPDTVAVSVMPAHAPVVTVEFTAREIQDSWRGVECADACHKIRSFALAYEKEKAGPRKIGSESTLKKGSDPFFPARDNGHLAKKGI